MPPRPARTVAQNRTLDALAARFEQWALTTTLLSRVTKGTVTSVAAGGASDGAALVAMTWQGTPNIPAPYVSSYTPTVGDVVAVTKTGPQLLILGRIIGTP